MNDILLIHNARISLQIRKFKGEGQCQRPTPYCGTMRQIRKKGLARLRAPITHEW